MEKTESTRRGRPSNDVPSINFCGRADFEKIEKIRTVAQNENIPIKEIYNKSFELFISAYETKHGKIKIPSKKPHGDINNLF